MTENRIGLSFAQAEGIEPLPSQLSLGVISPELSATMWAIVYSSLNNNIGFGSSVIAQSFLEDPWRTILRVWWVAKLYRNIDEFPRPFDVLNLVKDVITSRNYIRTFDFIQFVIQRPECPPTLSDQINYVLERGRAAYRIIDNHVLPLSSEAEVDAVNAALSVINDAEAGGPAAHMRLAATNLSNGHWAEAIRESIHAVEAAAKSIEPTATTLNPALIKLQSSIGLNPALAKAYGAL